MKKKSSKKKHFRRLTPEEKLQKRDLEQEAQYIKAITIDPTFYLSKYFWSGADCERLFFVYEVAKLEKRTNKQRLFLDFLANSILDGELPYKNTSPPNIDFDDPDNSTLKTLFHPQDFKVWLSLPATKQFLEKSSIDEPKELKQILQDLKPIHNPKKSNLKNKKRGKQPSPRKFDVKNAAKRFWKDNGDLSAPKLARYSQITKALAPHKPHLEFDSFNKKEYEKRYVERYGFSTRTVCEWIREAKKEYF